MKSATAIKKAWITVLLPFILLAAFSSKSAAQFVQHATTSTENFHYMVYDKNVEGRIYGAVAPMDGYEYPKLFISEDFGETWRLVFEWTDPYRMPGGQIWGRIMGLKPSKNSNYLYFQIDNTSSAYTNGLYRINHKTGEVKHYQLPNAENNSSLISYDVYDDAGDTVLMHTTWMLNGFILMTEIYLTHNGGESWDFIYDFADHDFVHMANVAFSPGNPDKLFLLRNGGISGVQAGLLISEDGGKTYTEKLAGKDWGPIAFNPENPNEIIIGSHMTSGTLTPIQHLMRSYDGGKTWEEIELEYSNFIYNYFTDIEYDPHDPNRIIVIEENQIFITDDGFKTYQNLMPSDYMFGQYASINPFNTDEMLIGIDGASVRHTLDRCQSWDMVNASRTSYGCTSLKLDGSPSPTITYVIDGQLHTLVGGEKGEDGIDNPFLSELVFEKVFTDSHDTSKLFLTDTSGTLYYKNGKDLLSTNIKGDISDLQSDPIESGKYWLSIGDSLAYIEIKETAHIDFSVLAISGQDPVTAFVLAQNQDQTAIWMARGSAIYQSLNNGQDWVSKSAGLSGDIKSITINPLNTSQLFASSTKGIYRSNDAGNSWQIILEQNQACKISCSPVQNGLVVIGTMQEGTPLSISYSEDGGDTWRSLSAKELHYCHVTDMDFYFGEENFITAHIGSSDMGRLSYRFGLECNEDLISVYPWSEDFEQGGIPLCWSQEIINGTTSWQAVPANDGIPSNAPAGSETKLQFHAESNQTQQSRIITPVFTNLTTLPHPMLTFSYTMGDKASLALYYQEQEDNPWTLLTDQFRPDLNWNQAQVLLPEGIEQLRLAFEASATTTEIQIDNIQIDSSDGLPCHDVRDLKASIGFGYIALDWIAPEGNYQASYNLYRDDKLLQDSIETTHYKDTSLAIGTHSYKITTLCRGKETTGTTLQVSYLEDMNPIQNLELEITNRVNGDIVAILQWDAPDGYTDAYYNVYRDNELIAQDLTTRHYTDTGFITNGEHEWSVTAVYGDAESEKTSRTVSCANRCAPIRDLEASYDIPATKVSLNWSKPGALPEDWLTYSYEPTNGIGFTEYGGYSIQIASRYTVEDIAERNIGGAQIDQIAFVPGEARATYFVRIWIGGNGLKPGNEMFIQRVLGNDLEIGQWNTVSLPSPVTIDPKQELWIGYSVDYTGESYAIGCDAGPGVENRNMIDLGTGDGWTTVDKAVENADFNLSVGAHLILPDGQQTQLQANGHKSQEPAIKYNVYRDGSLLTTTENTFFEESGLPEAIYNYTVTAVHPNGCESAPVTMDFFAGNTCGEPKNLTISSIDNSVSLTWDEAEPYWKKDSIFSESFDGEIPTTWLNLDKDGDGHKWLRSDSAFALALCTPYKGDGCVFSEVYDYHEDYSATLLAPDNWLISPAIELSSGRATLTYHVANIISQNSQTYYEVLISQNGTDYENFKVIDSDTLNATSSFIWYDKVVDLSGYTGTVHIAFRHHNDSLYTTLGIQLDEISVVEDVPIPRTYNVYRNNEKIAGPVEGTSYTDQTVPAGTHEYCIRSICNELGHESNPLCANATISTNMENVAQGELKAFPNPTTGQLFITSSIGIRHIAVYNIAGQKIIDKQCEGNTACTLDLSSYPDGIFLLEVDGKRIKITKQ